MARTDWKDADGTVTLVEVSPGRGGSIYTVSFNYKVGEHWYGGFFTGNSEYKAGDSIPVRYDPDDPDRNDLVLAQTRMHWGIGIAIAIGVILFLILNVWRS